MSEINTASAVAEVIPVSASAPEVIDDVRVNEIDAELNAVKDFAVSIIDRDGKLADYAMIGARFVKLAEIQKKHFKGFEDQDYDRLANRLADLIRCEVSANVIEVDVYVRLNALCELMEDEFPNVRRISFHTARNHLLSMVKWDRGELIGAVKKGYIDCLRELVRDLTSADRPSIKQVEARIQAARDEANGTKPVSDAKALANKSAKAESRIKTATATAMAEQALSKEQAERLLKSIATDHGLDVSGGFDPLKADALGCRQLALLMFNAGKLGPMKVLRNELARLIDEAEKQMAEAKAQAA